MTTGPIGASLKYISINSKCDTLTEYYSNSKNINIPIRTTTGCIGPTGISITNITINECGDIDGYYSNNTIARFGKIIVTGVTGITGEQGPLYNNLLIGSTGFSGPTGLPNSLVDYIGTGFYSVSNNSSYTIVINELRQPNTYYPTYFGYDIQCTNDTAVILTNSKYSSTTADYSIHIGNAPTGIYGQESNVIAIGGYVSGIGQEHSISIGTFAGYFMQNTESIAIGNSAGYQQYGINSIAIGSNAGMVQDDNSIALGYYSGNLLQNVYSIGMGKYAGSYLQNSYSIAIGNYAGYENQQSYSIAIGVYSGYTELGLHSIGIGMNTCSTTSSNCINIGVSSGYINQQESTIAIGSL
jgi:hypothetical protein